jgi:hypothetical protein
MYGFFNKERKEVNEARSKSKMIWKAFAKRLHCGCTALSNIAKQSQSDYDETEKRLQSDGEAIMKRMLHDSAAIAQR